MTPRLTSLRGVRLLVLALLLNLATFYFQFGLVHAGGSVHMIPEFQGIADHAEHFMVPMRDNVRLWTSVYFPKSMAAPAATILIRSPYAFYTPQRGTGSHGLLAHLLERGYVVVFQNERGRYWSEGQFHLLTNAGEDGYDTVDWISKQSWSNKKVGTYGCSSTGDSQVALLTHHHPAHVAAISGASGSSIGNIGPFNEQGLFYRGGAVQMVWIPWYITSGQRDFPKFPPHITQENRDWLAQDAMMNSWMFSEARTFVTANATAALENLPLQDAVRLHGGQNATDFDDLVRRQPNDPAWNTMSLLRPGDQIGAPTLWLFQTHDVGVGPNLAGFEYALRHASTTQARDHQHLIMSPLGHCSYQTETQNTVDGDREIGDARFPFEEVFTSWFDYWLRGVGPPLDTLPRAQVYLPGKNRWVSFLDWPPKGSRKTLYLDSRNSAASRLGDGLLTDTLPSSRGLDSYSYDPRYPVPTVGGDACCLAEVRGAIVKPGSYDQALVEFRKDVLVYTSAVIDQAFDVVGFGEVNLFVSSDAPDTDFTANLVDVAPDGRAFLLSGSIQRARWRDGYDKVRLMESGKVYKLRVGPFFVSNHFEKGHRIRVDIASSSFPRFDRNLNTGGHNYDEAKGRIAQNSVHHGADYASQLVLPVVELTEID